MGKKTIIRVEKNANYTVINNTSIYDKRLSWKAKGLHIIMLSRPDDWIFYKEELQKLSKDGRVSLDKGLEELINYNYVKRECIKDEKGRFMWETIVYEVPQEFIKEEQFTENPAIVKPETGNPTTENPSMENRQIISTKKVNTNKISTDKVNTDTPTAAVAVGQKNGDVYNFYIGNGFGQKINQVTQAKMDKWCSDLSTELVLHAMQIAIERNKVNWSYVEGILKNWNEKNVKSISDVNNLSSEFKEHQNVKYGKELIPDWLKGDNNENSSANIISDKELNLDFEAEREKILAKLSVN